MCYLHCCLASAAVRCLLFVGVGGSAVAIFVVFFVAVAVVVVVWLLVLLLVGLLLLLLLWLVLSVCVCVAVRPVVLFRGGGSPCFRCALRCLRGVGCPSGGSPALLRGASPARLTAKSPISILCPPKSGALPLRCIIASLKFSNHRSLLSSAGRACAS